MAKTITIRNLTSEDVCEVAHEFSATRAIIRYRGLLVLADCTDGRWELSGTPPSQDEGPVLYQLVAASGTLDETTVDVTH